METKTEKTETRIANVIESERYGAQSEREYIVRDLRALAERATRYAEQIEKAPDLRISDFAKLTPDLVATIDRAHARNERIALMISIQNMLLAERDAKAGS